MIYRIVFLFLSAFLARFNFFRIPKKGIVVLLYHRIDDRKTGTSLDKFSISDKIFEKQMIFLKKQGFIAILPQELDKIVKNDLWKKNKYVIITFDDGYKDNLRAAKILKKHRLKAVFFISSAHIGTVMDNAEMMNENDIKQLVSYGMAVGSHSHTHRKLSEMGNGDVKKEIQTSLNILTNFYKVEDFAYPFGNFNKETVEILKSSKIKRAYIIGQKIYRPNKHSSYEIPRAIIRKDTTILDFYLMLTRGRSKF